MATIRILRDCPANKIVDGEVKPILGPKAGTVFVGTLRPAGHPDNSEWHNGCVEIDTESGTWAFPAQDVEVI